VGENSCIACALSPDILKKIWINLALDFRGNLKFRFPKNKFTPRKFKPNITPETRNWFSEVAKKWVLIGRKSAENT